MATERVAREILAAVKAWRHWVGNGMLTQLDVPPAAGVRDRDQGFIQRMLQADAVAERTMLEYFELGPFRHAYGIWQKPGLKLFVSHISQARTKLQSLVDELSRYGIHCFLAHEAIRPASNWRDALLEALATMDALLSFHSEGFRDSEWCAQEVGFALGRNTNVVAVMDGEPPAGFIGAIQGIRWNSQVPSTAAGEIVTCLLAERQSAAALGDALARQLKFAGTWDNAAFCLDTLERCGQISDAARRNLELALLLNDQVQGNEHAIALVEQNAAAT